jgi:hypothetical protein
VVIAVDHVSEEILISMERAAEESERAELDES